MEPFFFSNSYTSIALLLSTMLAKISKTIWKRSLPSKVSSMVQSGFCHAKVVSLLSIKVQILRRKCCPCPLGYFMVATVKLYHKFGGLRQCKCIFLLSRAKLSLYSWGRLMVLVSVLVREKHNQ